MSGRKNILPAFKLVDGESLGESFDSEPVTVNTATHVCFNITTSDVTDNTGAFSVQHRIYKDSGNYSGWADLTLSAAPTLGDADAVFMLDLRLPPGQVRVSFTAAGGTPNGTVDVWVTGNSEG